MRFARRGEVDVVVKTGRSADLQREATALQLLGDRAVTVVDLVHIDDSTAQLVTTRVLPGDDLRPTARVDDDAAMVIIAELIGAMRSHHAAHTDRPDRPDLPELVGVLEPLLRCHDPRLPASLRDVAVHLGADLVASGDPVVLHGDLQHRNIARSRLEDADDWRVIDPHGWWGDSVFEAVAALVAPESLLLDSDVVDAREIPGEPLARLTRRRIAIIAEVTGDDPDRLRSWAFVGAVIAEARMIAQHDLVHGAPLALAQSLVASLRIVPTWSGRTPGSS